MSDNISIDGVSIEYDGWRPGDTPPYTYALVYRLGGMYLGGLCDIQDWEEVTEARFFDERGELHIWNDGDGFHSAKITEESDVGNAIDRLWINRAGNTLLSRQYLCADEDGQSYIALTRLLCYETRGEGGTQTAEDGLEMDSAEGGLEMEGIDREEECT